MKFPLSLLLLSATAATQAPVQLVSNPIRNEFQSVGTRTTFVTATFSAAVQDLWRTDGTPTGTSHVASGRIRELRAFGDRVLVALGAGAQFGSAADLAITDSALPGWTMLASPSSLWLDEGAVLGDRFVFTAQTSSSGIEPWVTDGTAAGTMQLAELAPGGAHSLPGPYLPAGDAVYFFSYDAGTGRSPLWRYDGAQLTQAHAGELGLVRTATRSGSKIFSTAEASFATHETVYALDLSTGNSTALTTSSTASGHRVRRFTAVGTGVVFNAIDASSDDEPWFSDGTPAGTARIVDLATNFSSSPEFSDVVVGGRVLFVATDSYFNRGVWATDGTPAGTVLLLDPVQTDAIVGSAGSDRAFLQRYTSPWHETFTTDGTPNGTTSFHAGTFAMHVHAGRVFGAAPGVLSGTVVLDAGATASKTEVGCGNGFRTPELESTAPQLGSAWTFTGRSAPAGATAGLLLGLPGTSWFGGACWSELDLGTVAVLQWFLVGTPDWSLTYPLPGEPALAGVTISAQAWFDPTSPTDSIEMTNGVVLTFDF